MMNDEETEPRWTSRKFWAAMFWMAVMSAMLAAGRLPVEAFVSVTYLLLGGYFVGNIAQKYIDKK